MVKTRKLRCYCGQVTIETTQVGNPPKCVGCNYCHSTLAESKNLCEQRLIHEWQELEKTKICARCMAEELIDK